MTLVFKEFLTVSKTSIHWFQKIKDVDVLIRYNIHHCFCWLVGLYCSTPLSTIFQLFRGIQLYWRGKPEYPQKNTDLQASHWQSLSH